MPFNINEIKAGLVGGGARPSLFSVQFSNPANSIADIKIPVLCRATSIPESRLGNIRVPYFGRFVNIAGDRVFDAWSVTIINDEDFLIRNAMEQWSNQINSHEGNLRTFSGPSPLLYQSDATVTQYSKTGDILRQYTMTNAYPAEISSIDLGWEETDRIEEFRVTFVYDSWNISGGSTGDIGGV